MPAIEEIAEDPQELRRCLRDLVAVSMLPAVWMRYDAQQIAESVTEVLVSMLGLEFACISLQMHGNQPAIGVARTRDRAVSDPARAILGVLARWREGSAPSETITVASPVGPGSVRVVLQPVAAGEDAILVAASRRAGFPSAPQRLLLGVVANQAAIAIRRWQAEHALQRLNETLEQRVAAEIEERMKVEEALRQAQKMEAIGQLTGGIAHDFNNLLTAVLGNLQLLYRRLAGDPAGLRLLDGALEGAERGAALTRRLLAFARQQELVPAAVDAAALVHGMLEMVRRSIGPRIEVERAFEAGLWPARVDANQLELALLNLAVNARDAMPEGGRLWLGARNASSDAGADRDLVAGDYVCLSVADSGAGMDEPTLARATEPFFTTKAVGQGTGLGLSMVHGLAAQSGGALRLSSRPGTGTTAELWLPRAEGPAVAAAPAPVTTPEAVRPSTVLLVDDDGLISTATAEMLKDLDHRVIEAPSGPRALELPQSGTAVDLVITDQAMPGMTGTQLAAEIREAWPDLSILLATGYAELPARGGLDLPRLRKPYQQASLAAAIAGLMRARRASALTIATIGSNGSD